MSEREYWEIVACRSHQLPKFKAVSAGDWRIVFYYDDDGKPRRVRVECSRLIGYRKSDWSDWEYPEYDTWGFTVEAKDYMDSNHATKIAVWGNSTMTGDSKKDEGRVTKWIEELMAGIEPEPRFKLSDKR